MAHRLPHRLLLAFCFVSWLFTWVSWATGASAEARVTELREPCAERQRDRQVFFGDLHVHSALSQDASTQGTRNRPADAYRFARGEALGIQPYDGEGQPGRRVRLDRPLDFAAVTDHAELLGETQICNTPGLPGHDSWICWLYRRWPRSAFFAMNWRSSSGRSRFGFCGPDGRDCLAAARGPWTEIQEAAEAAYDRSESCAFTSFVAYEWTGAQDYYNLHRNVVFRNDDVPELPPSFFEAGDAPALWETLRSQCLDAEGRCDALVIPHNPNLSGGWMYPSVAPDGSLLTAEAARRQAALEPLVEVMQHKGDSECALGGNDSVDELCGFEKLPYDGFVGKFVPALSASPPASSYVRGALLRGLQLEAKLGTNPYRAGLVASTDTHLGTPGAVSERDFPGHGGAGKPALDSVPVGAPDNVEFNPGGLAALWAEENTRDSLFSAMRRREAYGTSGPRIVARFFAGWDYPEDLCERPDRVRRAYAGGVPMGAVLPQRPSGSGEGDDSARIASPRFAVWARRDPGSEGRPSMRLERIQIIKGWLEDGVTREQVLEVAGDASGAAVIDLQSCRPDPGGPGADQLCAVWSDPDFDPANPAFYYARVVENPSCRWTQWVCLDQGVDCSEPESVDPELALCCDPEHRSSIRERAWTSPIWFRPQASPGSLPSPTTD